MIDVFQDQRVFLVPWIIVVITTCFVDVAHSLYLFIVAVSISFFDYIGKRIIINNRLFACKKRYSNI